MSQTELIWGAFSLMVLGALVTMCMKCQRTGNTRDKTGQTEQHIAADYAAPVERERRSTQAQTHSLRYEDQRRWEMPNSYLEEESPSYENVSRPPGSNGCDSTNAEIYENSTIIQLWKHSPMQGDSSDDGGGGEEPDYINADLQRW
ncbi:hypothetical protein JRQ81_008197 [Phrynocephalus forsythii]|uniref:Linker for activation of T-cells family member 2 n=1 Tax=Phrynocephalus forsythii TaxID=171643 RepID=A0A9Q1ASZ0_9SAUR|nr:hypothetical protein JRQ81_008197 [Phrynocephalus forsythii]